MSVLCPILSEFVHASYCVLPVTKTVCPPHCPERCSELDGDSFCCNTKCAAGCSGGLTESHCVVSVKDIEQNGLRWNGEGLG